ncbi:MAG: hypothetical protein V3U84_09165 [Thiotrichaceae bacterium]
MARSLAFEYQGNPFRCQIDKVDRSKLYGSVDIETRDMDGNVCRLANIANDGKTLVPYGGTAYGYLNPEQEWVCRKDITPVDYEGNKLAEVPSSFKQTLTLSETATIEEFLDHGIRLSYALTAVQNDEEDESDAAMDEGFLKQLAEGTIFRTDFSYRGGVDPDPAFILQDDSGTVWMLIAEDSELEFVGLEQAGVVAATQEQDDDEADDDLDFGML